jgi:signal transduction histidine kinase
MNLFADTSGFCVLLDADAAHHRRSASTWRELMASDENLVTTNCILVKTFALNRPLKRATLGLVCLVFLIVLMYLLSVPAHTQAQPQLGPEAKTILILHSSEANARFYVATDEGLSTTLQSGGIPDLNQFFESLDLRRNPGPEQRKLLVEGMRSRYSHRRLDMIITMFPEALEFVLKDCKDVLPDVPILALYLPRGFELPKTDRRIIKHFPRINIVGTLEAALKLVPGTKRVYVVSGAHEVDGEVEDQARHDLKKWETRLEFLYVSHISFEDMVTTVSSVPPGSIILLLVLTKDVTGKFYTTPEVARRLSQVSAAPIFGVLDTGLGHGIAGGSLINFEHIGTHAGQLALDILEGTKAPDNIPAVLDVPSVPMFDWRELRRWNLSVDALPKGSIVINREFTLWDFRYYIIGLLAFCLAETALVIYLIVQRRRKMVAEQALQEHEKLLLQNQHDLRELAGRLITAHEEERSHLARELHDDLTQRLAVLSIDAGKLEQELMNSPEPVREKLNNMKEQMVKLSRDIHNLARQLHPSILDDLGLVRAVESECTAFLEREGVDIVFSHQNISNIVEKDVALALYRIVQEGLRNISKHACANHVSVSLKGSDYDILLSIQDDGIGFDVAGAKVTPGIGLSSLRERVRLVKGELSIKSQPGDGTVIAVKVSLNSNRSENEKATNSIS